MASRVCSRFLRSPIVPVRFSSSLFSRLFLQCSSTSVSPQLRRSLPQPTYVTMSFFYLSTRNLSFDQGPSTIDYSSILPEDEFHKLADSTINELQEKVEEFGDEVQLDGFDVDYGNQVLTLKLGNLGTYVINKQTPNRQIWMSSPISGPSRFDWDKASKSWVYRRTKANLFHLLQDELEKLCGKSINLG